MAYRSPSHPLAFGYAGASSSEGPAILLEQSPARSKAPSDGPSEFSSWHDDASSSLAPSGTARDGTITVNPLVMRMGEHLKGKLQGMIRQRFDNYLHIIKTLQNDIGKLAALTCELRMTSRHASAAASVTPKFRISISCNEDGTFLVYTVPDAAGVLGSQCSSPASDDSQAETSRQQSEVSAVWRGRAPSEESNSDLLARWVQKVCDFGMSGRCHSLTSLFHFGFTAWKQLMHGASAWGMESVEDVSPGHIAEEEEKQSQEVHKEEALDDVGHEENASSAEDDMRSPEQLLASAKNAADSERLRQAAELCTEALDLLFGRLASSPTDLTAERTLSTASSSTTPACSAAIWRGANGDVLVAEESLDLLCELLCIRASAFAQMQQYSDTLADAEELSSLQPTCADGYYWQCVAMQGLGRHQEALEALMSALEYEPQNAFYQQLLTALFEDVSDTEPRGSLSGSQKGRPGSSRDDRGARTEETNSAREVLPRPRGTGVRDALSTTTQATHLSSRSTTPTEVSEVVSRSSSNDSLYVDSAAFEENA